MKALVADISTAVNFLNRLKMGLFQSGRKSSGIGLAVRDVPEPSIPGPDWVKIRSIVSGISDMDMGLILDQDPTVFGLHGGLPIVPGNENLGLVIDIGAEVKGIELGERVVVNPLLSCVPRGVRPQCASCAAGRPTQCTAFLQGDLGPGMMIGGCRDSAGGWGDWFVAHKSQIRQVPQAMESDTAALVPEFTRACRAAIEYFPAEEESAVVVGAASMGLLVMEALSALGAGRLSFIAAEYPFETDLVRKLYDAHPLLMSDPHFHDAAADILHGSVLFPSGYSPVLLGGADIVFETTGIAANIQTAMGLVREGGRLALVSPRNTYPLNGPTLWTKGITVSGTLFSARESQKYGNRETFDIALELIRNLRAPAAEIITHKFTLEEHETAFARLANREAGKVIKAFFRNVV